MDDDIMAKQIIVRLSLLLMLFRIYMFTSNKYPSRYDEWLDYVGGKWVK